MITGLDAGYGYTKVAYFDGANRNGFIIPSRVSRYIPQKSFDESFEAVYVDDKPFLVGSDTEGSARVGFDFVGGDEYLAIIGYCLSRINGVKKILVLGLPPQAYEDEKTRFLKDLVRRAEIRLPDGTKVYVPPKVEFVPQGAGIYFAYLSDNGFGNLNKTSVVVDIGYHTMDVVLFSDGKFKAHMSRSYSLGVKALYDMTRDAYIKKYSIFISPDRDEVVERFLRDGSIPHPSGVHTLDIKTILDDFYANRVMKIIGDYIAEVGEHGYMVEKIILGGGGVAYAGNVSGAYVMPDPQFGNAKGFMEYGMNLL